jgi:DNA polymerase-3 subunit alpha
MKNYFTHLHLHTDFSLLDGAITLDKVVDFAKTHKLPAVAISDHGNIFGAVKFFQKCKKAGVKPVLGMEAYVTNDRRVRDNKNRYYHLLLLVENEIGYRNLCKLIHHSYTEGFYFKPRIDYELLEQYSEGLISSTTCLGGHIPQLLLKDRDAEAIEVMDRMLGIFGEDHYFIEVQPDDQNEQKIINNKLFEISQQKGIPIFASADCHYSTAEDHYAHEVMLAIQTRHKMSDANRMTFGDCRAHMRTEAEMRQMFPGKDDILWRTGQIADRCNFEFETGKLFFPKFEIPHQETEESYFTKLCNIGLRKLFDTNRIATDNPSGYWERLQLEIDLITSMGFITYFLVVSDFIQWAKRQKIPVGPGRGSAAGSLVAWALEITDIDPLRYNLLFERFLNPERVTMPDIDIDFCINGREKVINYVRDKYGHDKVCQIITFGTMMAKGVLKDVARALGMPFEDANAITNLIPDQLKITLKEALEQEPRLEELRNSNPKVAQVFDIALRLEGLTRHASKHAAGLVITPEPIKEMLPVYIPPKTSDVVTQYAMTELESIGFLKMDFLGLKNLTLIQQALELIKNNHGAELDPNHLPLEDAATFELLAKGDTTGVFQLESSGLKDVLRRLKPESFEDIIAVNALYRPGPLGSGMVDDFIECRHGRQKITYIFPELEPILKETYGVIVYQEQVMKIASTIADYSLGEADILRRAMGKKKAEVMEQQRKLFASRAIDKQFNEKKAGELFDLMAFFAGYGFNKSHSAAYGMIAYQTAYLKAHYPAEFMACLISLEARDPEKMAFYIQEAKDMGIDVLPPDINESENNFATQNKSIRFGMHGIKSAGGIAIDMIIAERTKKGSFKDLLDFCTRVDLRTANKRVIESMIAAGAFDSLSGNRAQQTEELAQIMERANEKKTAAATGQMGLFAPKKAADSSDSELYSFSPLQEWNDKVKLEKEKEVLGLYISAQPLDSYKKQLGWLGVTGFKDAAAKPSENAFCCGVLKSFREITTKKGDRMAFVKLEDHQGSAELVVFPKVYKLIADQLKQYTIFVVRGALDEAPEGQCKIKANEIIPIDLIFEDWSYIKKVSLAMPETIQEATIQAVKDKLIAGKTAFEIKFNENGKELLLAIKDKFSCDMETLLQMHEKKIKITLSI